MLRKRMIGVVTVKQGWVVQSFGFKKYLPIGKVDCILENLDRWGIDEILVQVIDRSSKQSGPDYQLLEQISRLRLATPITYAGGIRHEKDAVAVIKTGADRVCVDALIGDVREVEAISYRLGAQAVVASMPIVMLNNNPVWFDYRTGKIKKMTPEIKSLFECDVISEIFMIDKENEGKDNGFNKKLLAYFQGISTPIIAFGGISNADDMSSLLGIDNISAVAIGNFLNYKEHAVQNYKLAIAGVSIRPESYLATTGINNA